MALIRPSQKENISLTTDPEERGPRTEVEPKPISSVLIVTHNCVAALRRCLAALEASGARETFEVIVVDCASSDGCGQIDGEFPDVTLLRLPRNMGRTRARNIGARTAKGDYLVLLDPDVEVRPDVIGSLAGFLADNEEAIAACPLLIDENRRSASRTGPLPEPSALYGAWARGENWAAATLEVSSPGSDPVAVECPDPAAVAARIRAIKGMNYFDERYGEFGSDLELATQAYRASKRIFLLPAITAVARRGKGPAESETEAAATCLQADYGNGVAAYVEKYYGWGAGLKIRLRMMLRALGSFRLGLLSQLLAGQKIDGSQRAV